MIHPFDWLAHYRNHRNHHEQNQSCSSSPLPPIPLQGDVAGKSNISIPNSDNVGSQHVDGLLSPNDGVWHPHGPVLLDWGGINPFVGLQQKRLIKYYTEAFQPQSASLQWALHQNEREHTETTRSNISLATQSDRPEWLSRPQYLAFCSIRAYPLLQLRKILCALRDRSLPFGRQEVQVLIKSALYQVGALRGLPNEPTLLSWKHEDLVVGGGLCKGLRVGRYG